MKRFARMMCVVFFVVLLSTTTIAFAGAQDFTLVNHTGHDITAVYVSPSSADNWQEDILGNRTLDNGYKLPITFSRNATSTYWDLKVVFANGSSSSWSHFNLKAINTITLNRDRTASYE